MWYEIARHCAANSKHFEQGSGVLAPLRVPYLQRVSQVADADKERPNLFREVPGHKNVA